MKIIPLLSLVGFICLLFGCSSSPYKQKNGTWYYDKSPMYGPGMEGFKPLNSRFARSATSGFYRYAAIFKSDGKTFEALSEHYAKDKKTVYYCDTYRSGEDYFISKRNRIIRMAGVDPASFVWLEDKRYARDKENIYYEDQPFTVKDIDSFEFLVYDYAKDKRAGYYSRVAINGSDGKTFTVLDDHYSKDTNNVYYSLMSSNDPNMPAVPKSFVIQGANTSSFNMLADGYATDGGTIFYDGAAVGPASSAFVVLSGGYATTKKDVLYKGKIMKEANAKTFMVLEAATDSADSKDDQLFFLKGIKSKR